MRRLMASGTATTAMPLQGSDLYLWEHNIPLIEAAKNGHVDVVQFLISLPRIDINARYYMVQMGAASPSSRAAG